MLHYLRLAVTALSLTACVLLVALWVRSYSRFDFVHGQVTSTRFAGAASCSRGVFVGCTDEFVGLNAKYRQWRVGSVSLGAGLHFWQSKMLSSAGTYVGDTKGFFFMRCTILAALPWIRRRFTLRTLLIATTLVAVGLGTIIALS